MVREIALKSSKYPNLFSLVDDEDYDRLMSYSWFPEKVQKRPNCFYASSYIKREKGFIKISLHRFIMNAFDSDIQIDHIDDNRLNNQKNNLRFVTHAQNKMNTSKNSRNKSGYKGVHWNERRKKWIASIGINHRTIYLGGFDNVIEAAKKYDEAAKIYFEEFGKLNFPSGKMECQ